MGKLSPVERFFCIGCFSNADDEGPLVGNPAYLHAVTQVDPSVAPAARTMGRLLVPLCATIALHGDHQNGYERG